MYSEEMMNDSSVNTKSHYAFKRKPIFNFQFYLALRALINTTSDIVQYASALVTELISMDQLSENRINSEYMFAYWNDRKDLAGGRDLNRATL